MTDEEVELDSLDWHALNYRTAHFKAAHEMWLKLEDCVDRKIAAAVAAERERCAVLCDQLDAMSRDPLVCRGSAQECAEAIRKG